MKARIAVSSTLGKNSIEEQMNIGGKMAAICYMKDDYDKIENEDEEKSIKRFERVTSTGHHSVADHSYYTVVFENIPKMTAMILNSLQCYNTSEKSGRYTEMAASSKQEQELYDKWKNKFFNIIKEKYSNKFDEKQIMKLAQENARYVLSVFTPSTTMAYTTTIRQWTYIVNWCDFYIKNNNTDKNTSIKYYKDLFNCIKDLRNSIVELGLYIKELSDNKHRRFNFLVEKPYDLFTFFKSKDHFGSVYSTTYMGSFVQLAQAQRHRTLRYLMYHNPEKGTQSFYVPDILEKSLDISEWLIDLQSIEDITPQATLVEINETGTIDNFILKCKERLCGRAQLEIMKHTKETLEEYYNNSSNEFHCFFNEFIDSNGKAMTKCCSVNCKEPCIWGKKGLERDI